MTYDYRFLLATAEALREKYPAFHIDVPWDVVRVGIPWSTFMPGATAEGLRSLGDISFIDGNAVVGLLPGSGFSGRIFDISAPDCFDQVMAMFQWRWDVVMSIKEQRNVRSG